MAAARPRAGLPQESAYGARTHRLVHIYALTMTHARRVAGPLALWLVVMCVLGFVVARGQTQERDRLVERFDNRAATGSEFVTAYVEDVLGIEERVSEEVSRAGWEPSQLSRTTELLGFSTAVLLDDRGLVTATAPPRDDLTGIDLAVRQRHLSTALGGTPSVSDVVPSAETDPIVAFAAPLASERYAVFAGTLNLSTGPLGEFLQRQPIAGTYGVLLDSHGQTIVAAGRKSALARSLLGELRQSSYQAIQTEERVVVGAPVAGTGWTIVLDAPRSTLLAPATANNVGEWGLLAAVALISLVGLLLGLRSQAVQTRQRSEKEMLAQRLRLTAENAPIGMALVELDHRFVEPNRRLCEMLGYSGDELSRLTFEDVTHPDDVPIGLDRLAQLVAGEIDAHEMEKRYVRKDGSLLWGRLSVSVVRADDGTPLYFVKQVEDVTEVRKARAELQHRALYDPLTRLANRGLLMDRLTTALGNDRNRANVGVGYCDLDHFKNINDTHGHQVGDEVLKEVARRLQETVRGDDTVARLGGDEFVILLHDVASLSEATTVMERAGRLVKEPMRIGGVTVWTSLSAGLAVAPSGSDPDVLIRDADAALYAAKHAGRGQVQVHDHHRNQVRDLDRDRA